MWRDLQEAIARLSEMDYKITPQRRAVLQAFFSHADRHLSADEVLEIVKLTNPEMGLATIYRTVELLAEVEILEKLHFGDGRTRYELSSAGEHHHHHLICVDCGSLMEFEDDLLENVEKAITSKLGFKILDHQLKVMGLCPDCQRKAAVE